MGRGTRVETRGQGCGRPWQSSRKLSRRLATKRRRAHTRKPPLLIGGSSDPLAPPPVRTLSPAIDAFCCLYSSVVVSFFLAPEHIETTLPYGSSTSLHCLLGLVELLLFARAGSAPGPTRAAALSAEASTCLRGTDTRSAPTQQQSRRIAATTARMLWGSATTDLGARRVTLRNGSLYYVM